MNYTANTTRLPPPRSSRDVDARSCPTRDDKLASRRAVYGRRVIRDISTHRHAYLSTYLPGCLLACRCIRSWAAHGETLHAAGIRVGIRVYVPVATHSRGRQSTQRKDGGRRRWREGAGGRTERDGKTGDGRRRRRQTPPVSRLGQPARGRERRTTARRDERGW